MRGKSEKNNNKTLESPPIDSEIAVTCGSQQMKNWWFKPLKFKDINSVITMRSLCRSSWDNI